MPSISLDHKVKKETIVNIHGSNCRLQNENQQIVLNSCMPFPTSDVSVATSSVGYLVTCTSLLDYSRSVSLMPKLNSICSMVLCLSNACMSSALWGACWLENHGRPKDLNTNLNITFGVATIKVIECRGSADSWPHEMM